MEYYAIFIPNNTSNFAIKSFYNNKIEALGALKLHKDARMKAFSSSEEAVYFYLHGPSEAAAPVGGGGGAAAAAPGSPIPSAERKVPKSPFVAPSSQKLVAFRKLIEGNNIEEVRTMVLQNPRYLISSGDTPTILKEGPRYNALHITAIEGRSDICRLILQTIENPSYVELLHGQRTSSTDEVTAILLDLYLNTPDKCRNETPLHFAAKLGWVDVVKELIAFPQCQVKQNKDGMYPREIICSRAKPANSTVEIREAIYALLKENFFVPVIRTEDNSLPPVVGEPFSPTELPRLDESRDKLNARREIKAYAGPMDQEKAVRFCKRWKTPPRLKILGATKIQSDSKLSEMRKSSTPIKAVPRRLFANRSFDGRLEEEEGGEQEQRNNNTLIDSSLDESLELGEKFIPDDNGNHLRMAVPYTPKRLFLTYRNHLANDSIDTEDSYCGNETDAANFSYVCEETQTTYEKANVTESPSFKERSIRITDPAKGLETVGRMLAEKEQVGWKEHWSFLGTFCNIADEVGLTLLEQYLAQKKKELEGKLQGGDGDGVQETESIAESNGHPTCQKDHSFNDVMNMICESTEKMSLNIMADDLLQRTPVSNPYRCLLNSLHVFGTRLVNSVLKPTSKSATDDAVGETFQAQIRQLEKLLENYRTDAAFRMIDFSKVHSLFAYLIVANVPRNNRTDDGKPSNMWNSLLRSDSLNETAKCVAKRLSHFSDNPTMVAPLDFTDQTDWNSKTIWEDNVHILPCNCRTDVSTHTAGKGILERMNKRREKRAFRTPSASESVPPNVVVDFHTYRSAPAGRELTPEAGSFDEDERYYSCSDSENEQEDVFFTPPSSPKVVRKDHNGNSHGEIEDGAQLTKTNCAVATDVLADHQNGAEEDSSEGYSVFISGSLPTQHDFDVWNVLKMVDVEPLSYPHVYAWKCAMAEYHA